MKPEADTLLTVPDAPPEAGPDRALDPPPPDPSPPAELLPVAVAEGDAAGAEDVPQAESPITAHIGAAAMIHRLLLFARNRRTLGRRGCLALVTESDKSGEGDGGGGDALPGRPALPAIVDADIALETG